MSTTDILHAALNLPYDQGWDLAQKLTDSLHPPGEEISSEEWEAACAAEVQRRIEMVERGEMEEMSLEEAMTSARRILAEKRAP